MSPTLREHGPLSMLDLFQRGIDPAPLIASGEWAWDPCSLNLRRTDAGLRAWWAREAAEERGEA